MINKVTIRNFKCFKRIDLEDFRRINIIVGPSGSGKTALLESLYFGCTGAAANLFQFRTGRGVPIKPPSLENTRWFEDVWGDMFFQNSKQLEVMIESKPEGKRMFGAFYDEKVVAGAFTDESIGPVVVSPIVFKWKVGDKEDTLKTWMSKDMIQFNMNPVPHYVASFHGANEQSSIKENALRFSELSKRLEAESLVEAIRNEFPLVRNLSLEVSNDEPAVHATIKGLRQKMPLEFVSNGITKLFSILLSIVDSKGGVILIDEFENGLFYKNLESMWRIILDFAKSSNSQVFASTHSLENLLAVSNIAKSTSEDFSLVRTRRNENGVNVSHFSGDQFISAIHQGFEVR